MESFFFLFYGLLECFNCFLAGTSNDSLVYEEIGGPCSELWYIPVVFVNARVQEVDEYVFTGDIFRRRQWIPVRASASVGVVEGHAFLSEF